MILEVYVFGSSVGHGPRNELDSTLVGRGQTSQLKSCQTWALSTWEKCPESVKKTPFSNFELL